MSKLQPKPQAPLNRAKSGRGSISTSQADAQFLTGEIHTNEDIKKAGAGPRLVNKHRLVQTGTWNPSGTSMRVMYAASSDAGCSMDGERKTNQDSFLINVPDSKSALFGVYDGHGEHGHLVSRCCRSKYVELLKAQQAKRPNDFDAATREAYLDLDQECNADIDCSQSGERR